MTGLLKTFDLTPIDALMIPICACMFFVFTKLLERSLFRPFLKLHEAREKSTIGDVKNAGALNDRAAELDVEYESQIVQARVAAFERRSSMLNETKKKAAEMIEGTEKRSEQMVVSQKAKLESDRRSLMSDLGSEVAKISLMVIERLNDANIR